jgi:hypothetical protein
MAQTPDLGNYVDVAERITEFRAKHPEGCLQPADPAQPFQVVTMGEQTFVVVVAAAYRSPDDPRPGIGMAQELVPGRTPYTRGSELQNAETSAWGRAIVAVLAADTKRGVASANEVQARQAERDQPPLASNAQLQALGVELTKYGLTERQDRLTFVSGLVGRELASSKELTTAEAARCIKTVREQNDAPDEPQWEKPVADDRTSYADGIPS